MFASTVVMKIAKKGYKRYGVPGAVVAGGGTLLGIRYVKRRLSGTDTGPESDTAIDSATDTQSAAETGSSGN